MSSTKVRIGILGCGRITRRGLVPGILGSSTAQLAALASLRPGVAETLAKEIGCGRTFSSYEALIDDPNIDAVYIPTTGEEHARWTLRAAAAGKHVLCEKSLALSVAEAERMAVACRQGGIILQEAFMWRHHPRSKRVRELVASGEIGDLRLILASFSFTIDQADWRLDPRRGGGASWDVGCYGVNASRFFAGAEPTGIHAAARFNDRGADTTMQFALNFPGDAFANIDCSFEAPYRCQVELIGSRGMISLPNAFLPPQDGAVMYIRRGTDRDVAPETISFAPANQYVEQVDHFCASIAAGQLLEPAESGVANMRVIERALEIARG